jgi:hypothetical protein
MKCQVCGKLNHKGRGEEAGEGILINPGVYIKEPPQYYCMTCARLISDSLLRIQKVSGLDEKT